MADVCTLIYNIYMREREGRIKSAHLAAQAPPTSQTYERENCTCWSVHQRARTHTGGVCGGESADAAAECVGGQAHPQVSRVNALPPADQVIHSAHMHTHTHARLHACTGSRQSRMGRGVTGARPRDREALSLLPTCKRPSPSSPPAWVRETGPPPHGGGERRPHLWGLATPSLPPTWRWREAPASRTRWPAWLGERGRDRETEGGRGGGGREREGGGERWGEVGRERTKKEGAVSHCLALSSTCCSPLRPCVCVCVCVLVP